MAAAPAPPRKFSIGDAGAAGFFDNTGGNSRGANANDFQLTRANAAQVASGANAFIGGGENNQASGSRSVVCGGRDNRADGSYGVVCGGDDNKNDGAECVIVGGVNNDILTAGAVQCVIAGGGSNVISGARSYAAIVGGTGVTVSANYAGAVAGQTIAVSGTNSFACGGLQLTVAGTYAACVAGYLNNISAGTQGAIVGGNGHSMSVDRGFIGGGASCTVSGVGGAIIAGATCVVSSAGSVAMHYQNTASNLYTLAMGAKSNANLYGQIAVGADWQQTAGNKQWGWLTFGLETTNDTKSEMLLLTVAGQRMTLVDGDSYDCTMWIHAKAPGANSASWRAWAFQIYRAGSTTTLVDGGAGVAPDKSVGSLSAATVDLSADDTNDRLLLEGTGLAATNISWTVSMFYVKSKRV